MPGFDSKSPEHKITMAMALAVGFIVGIVVMIVFWDDEASGGLCWMSGCFSSFVVFIIGAYAWGKKAQQAYASPGPIYEAHRVVTPPPPQPTRAPPQPSPRPMQMPSQRAPPTPTMTVDEVLRAIGELPEGLPQSLWGRDWRKLAEAVVRGDKVAGPDGRPVVSIEGRWYHADIDDLATFLQEWSQ